tara:strand:+ start:7962 stop:8228 length:267 start_codon:yes stop_codon:yes gene_type:complete
MLGDLGIGAGGGVVGGITTVVVSLLLIRQRLDRMEVMVQDKVVMKEQCQTVHSSVDKSLERIEKKLDDLTRDYREKECPYERETRERK